VAGIVSVRNFKNILFYLFYRALIETVLGHKKYIFLVVCSHQSDGKLDSFLMVAMVVCLVLVEIGMPKGHVAYIPLVHD
jgi:hypothetical protein